MYAFPYEGYWKDVGTVKSLWAANMDLLAEEPALNLYDKTWRIFSGNRDLPPHYIGPHAQSVSVVGDFNTWDVDANPMTRVKEDESIWVAYIPEAKEGNIYKYAIKTYNGEVILKSDPYGFQAEVRPAKASRIANLKYTWKDGIWQRSRKKYNSYTSPMRTLMLDFACGRADAYLTNERIMTQMENYPAENFYAMVLNDTDML